MSRNQKPNPKVVIVGANFAGLSVALGLFNRKTPVNVTLIDKRAHFEYTPSLHLALDNFSKTKSITIDLKKTFPDAFMQTEVIKVDFNKKQVVTTNKKKFKFDYLVIATGSETNFYDNQSFIDCALPLRQIEDVARVNRNLDSANKITVIGGGYTGLEIATVLAERTDKKITLVHSRANLLDGLGSKVSSLAENYVRKKNITLVLNNRVKTCFKNSILLESGKKLTSDLHILTAGIKINNQLLPKNDQLNSFLQLEKNPQVFVCGDVATSGRLPTAHNAMLEGRIVAQHLDDLVKGKKLTYAPPYDELSEILAIALGPNDGILTYKKHGLYIPKLVGFFKWLIEQRVLFELKYKVVLPL